MVSNLFRRLAAASAIAVGLVLAQASTANAEAPDRIVIALAADVDNFDVISSAESGLILSVAPNIVETLAYWNPATASIEPLLATSWEWVEPTRLRVKLREGVRFSDGRPLTAADVAASLNFAVVNNKPLRASYFSTLAEAVAVDDATVDLVTSKADPLLVRRLQFMYVVPADMATSEALANKVIGTGPFKLEAWNRGQNIILVRNPEYSGDSGVFDEIEFISRPEASVRSSAVQAGEAHIAVHLAPEQTLGLPQVKSIDSNQVAAFVLNTVGQTEGSPLEDVRVRQAINYAVDRNAIIAAIFSGMASLPKGQYNPTWMSGTNPELVDYAYDPDKAKALIETAGAAGAEIRIRTNYGVMVKAREVTEAVAYYLQQVGFKTSIQATDWASIATAQTAHREGGNAPYDLFLAYHSNEFLDSSMRSAERLLSRAAGNGTWLIANDALDAAILDVLAETNLDLRAKKMADAWTIVRDEALILPLAVPQVSYGMAANLEWEPRPDDRIYVQVMSWK